MRRGKLKCGMHSPSQWMNSTLELLLWFFPRPQHCWQIGVDFEFSPSPVGCFHFHIHHLHPSRLRRCLHANYKTNGFHLHIAVIPGRSVSILSSLQLFNQFRLSSMVDFKRIPSHLRDICCVCVSGAGNTPKLTESANRFFVEQLEPRLPFKAYKLSLKWANSHQKTKHTKKRNRKNHQPNAY